MIDPLDKYYGLAHLKREGKPAHPNDVYIHCGCKKCDEKFRKQALAYYRSLDKEDLSAYYSDRWFPEALKS